MGPVGRGPGNHGLWSKVGLLGEALALAFGLALAAAFADADADTDRLWTRQAAEAAEAPAEAPALDRGPDSVSSGSTMAHIPGASEHELASTSRLDSIF